MMFCKYVYSPQACTSRGGQERTFNSLVLELQRVVSHDMGAGNQTWVFQKSSRQYS